MCSAYVPNFPSSYSYFLENMDQEKPYLKLRPNADIYIILTFRDPKHLCKYPIFDEKNHN